jgi:hypothetical protein
MLAKDRRRQPSLERSTPHSERSGTIGSRSARVLLGRTEATSVKPGEQDIRTVGAVFGKQVTMTLASLGEARNLILASLEETKTPDARARTLDESDYSRPPYGGLGEAEGNRLSLRSTDARPHGGGLGGRQKDKTLARPAREEADTDARFAREDKDTNSRSARGTCSHDAP